MNRRKFLEILGLGTAGAVVGLSVPTVAAKEPLTHGAITTNKISTGTITADNISSYAVKNDDIAESAVKAEKLEPVAYYTGNGELYPPDLESWAVAKGFPRKHKI